ncbi:MAG: THUMP domain-containing protein [Candidatus Woesearchaeota archaeon]|nr:THUMP domain-containing protein [Candidatus Woesearchaeota archaeon]
MQAIAITNPGIESIAEKEIVELIKPKITGTEESVVFFRPKELIDLCVLCYKAQSLSKVMLLKDMITFRDKNEIFCAAKKLDFSDFIKKGLKFKVKCMHTGEHDFNSIEIEEGIGANIKGDVDLDNPDVIIFVYINKNRCYIGIDFSGFDMSKRQYRVFNLKESLKATVAYSLLRIADYRKKDFLLDPFCGSGVIPIEAALFGSDFPVNYFTKNNFLFLKFDCFRNIGFDKFFEKIDKKIVKKNSLKIYGYESMLGYVKASHKNAKIAGINKSINIRRVDLDWLDTKVDKTKVDKIVTTPPQLTERNSKVIEKLYKEFFYQAEFVLKKNGIIVVVSETEETKKMIEKHASQFKFKITKEMKIMQGKKQISALVIKR